MSPDAPQELVGAIKNVIGVGGIPFNMLRGRAFITLVTILND